MDQMNKFGKDSMDVALNSFGAWSKNAQAIASEVADYSKKSFEDTAAAWEKLIGAKSLEKAMEAQSEYLKSSYEDFIAQSTKLGELYVDLAKEAYKPFEGVLAKAAAIEVMGAASQVARKPGFIQPRCSLYWSVGKLRCSKESLSRGARRVTPSAERLR
jgi:phasin family protein